VRTDAMSPGRPPRPLVASSHTAHRSVARDGSRGADYPYKTSIDRPLPRRTGSIRARGNDYRGRRSQKRRGPSASLSLSVNGLMSCSVLSVAVSDFYSLPDDEEFFARLPNVIQLPSGNPSEGNSNPQPRGGERQAEQEGQYLILKELRRYSRFNLGDKWGRQR
jgi:hypothetical protein